VLGESGGASRGVKGGGRDWVRRGKLQLGRKCRRKDLWMRMMVEDGKMKVLCFDIFYGKKFSGLYVGRKLRQGATLNEKFVKRTKEFRNCFH